MPITNLTEFQASRPPLPTTEEMPLNEWLSDPDCIVLNTHHWSGVRIAMTVWDMPLLDAAFANRWRWEVEYRREYPAWLVRLCRRNLQTNKTEHMQIGNLWLPGVEVDHIYGSVLDNRRKNVRAVTRQENNYNKTLRIDNSSGYAGVSPRGKKWRARIAIVGNQEYLGTYAVKIAAAQIYDRRAREVFGEYACLNFPNAGERSAITGKIQRP